MEDYLSFSIWSWAFLFDFFIYGVFTILPAGCTVAFYLPYFSQIWLLSKNLNDDFAKIGLAVKVYYYHGPIQIYTPLVLFVFYFRAGTLSDSWPEHFVKVYFDILARMTSWWRWPAQPYDAGRWFCFYECQRWHSFARSIMSFVPSFVRPMLTNSHSSFSMPARGGFHAQNDMSSD